MWIMSTGLALSVYFPLSSPPRPVPPWQSRCRKRFLPIPLPPPHPPPPPHRPHELVFYNSFLFGVSCVSFYGIL